MIVLRLRAANVGNGSTSTHAGLHAAACRIAAAAVVFGSDPGIGWRQHKNFVFAAFGGLGMRVGAVAFRSASSRWLIPCVAGSVVTILKKHSRIELEPAGAVGLRM